MEYLSMTRDAFEKHINSTRTLPINKVTVSAAILRKDSTKKKQILLLKRNEEEQYYPNVFEIPGGKFDATDNSIQAAIIREVAEETHLTVSHIISSLPPMTYTTEKTIAGVSGEAPRSVLRHAFQLNYAVAIEGDGTGFCVNKDEHSMGVWACADDLASLPMTAEMRCLVSEVLDVAGEVL
ncbi:hypothetical protein QQX98_006154 [Neonectria punicea]|uniref:Nudix hydrolase domain-containing protein n=1 Tax=Neonectria punicea TaxID=979145 RepID=A0ABR1H218_9HYPO